MHILLELGQCISVQISPISPADPLRYLLKSCPGIINFILETTGQSMKPRDGNETLRTMINILFPRNTFAEALRTGITHCSWN